MHKVSSTLLICIALSIASLAWAGAEEFEVIGVQGHVERASGPPELLTLDKRDVVTPRALLAFDKLPKEYVSLALALRGSGIDLLRADGSQLDALIAQAEAGELDVDPEELRGLRELLATRSYLSWEPVIEGHRLVPGELLRAGDEASVSLRTASGVESTINPNGMVRLDPENPALAWSSQNRAEAKPLAAQVQEQPHAPEQSGEPAGDMSPRAAELFGVWTEAINAPDCPLRLQGPIAVNETSEEIHLALPLKSYVPDAGDGDSAQSVIHARYSLGSDGEMPFTLQLPPLIWLFDKDGEPIGLLRMAKQKTTGIWAEAIQRPVQMNVLLQGVELLLGVSSIQEEAVERIDIEQLVWQSDMAQGEQALWTGNGQFQARNVRIRECGEQVMDIGSVTVDMQVQDHDLEAFLALIPEEVDDTLVQDREAAEYLVRTMLAASGTGKFSLTLNDLEAGAKIDPESLHIGQLEILGEMGAEQEGSEYRDVNTTYSLSDLKLKTEASDLALEEISFTVGLTGLNPKRILDLADLGSSGEEGLLGAFQDLLSGMDVNFSLSGLSGNHDRLDLSVLHSMSAGLSLAGVNSPAQDIGLRYGHKGLRDMQGVPAELVPEDASLDVRLSQVPILELALASLMGEEEAQAVILDILSRFGTRLELEQLGVDLPGGSLTARGLALARSPGSEENGETPVLDMETELEIRGLEHLVQVATRYMQDEEDIQQVQALAAFIQLAAEEGEVDGTTVHSMKIRGDSLGHITVNSKDLSPLFSDPGAQGGKE